MHAARPFKRPPALVIALVIALALGLTSGLWVSDVRAQGEPPIRNAQDAACRDQARAQVFSTPDPNGLGPYAIGRQIYNACMRRAAGQGRRPRRQR